MKLSEDHICNFRISAFTFKLVFCRGAAPLLWEAISFAAACVEIGLLALLS